MTNSSGRCSMGNWLPPSVDGSGVSISVPSGFFLLVYFRFSGLEPGDSAPPATGAPGAGTAGTLADAAPCPLAALMESRGPAGVFPAFGRFGGGGVTPPLASRFAASFCSLASSARSRLDMIPSFGGRPGPRRRTGCWPSASMDDCIACDESASLDLRTSRAAFESFFSDSSLPSFSPSALVSSTSNDAMAFSSTSICCSSIRSAPVSPMGTSGSKKRMRTPPIWM